MSASDVLLKPGNNTNQTESENNMKAGLASRWAITGRKLKPQTSPWSSREGGKDST